jgi:hypothetical protein
MTSPIGSRVEQFAQVIAERLVPMIIDAIDIDSILDRVDVDKIIQRVDIDAVLQRVDINQIIDQVDIEKVIEKVDIQKVIERVDINTIVNEIDIDALVEQTELGSIIARSTTGILTEILDVIRSQGVGLDDFILRWSNRLVGRGKKIKTWPEGPPLLVERTPETPAEHVEKTEGHTENGPSGGDAPSNSQALPQPKEPEPA